jgi:hypothetical protein
VKRFDPSDSKGAQLFGLRPKGFEETLNYLPKGGTFSAGLLEAIGTNSSEMTLNGLTVF